VARLHAEMGVAAAWQATTPSWSSGSPRMSMSGWSSRPHQVLTTGSASAALWSAASQQALEVLDSLRPLPARARARNGAAVGSASRI
jgi:hypothetical protein